MMVLSPLKMLGMSSWAQLSHYHSHPSHCHTTSLPNTATQPPSHTHLALAAAVRAVLRAAPRAAHLGRKGLDVDALPVAADHAAFQKQPGGDVLQTGGGSGNTGGSGSKVVVPLERGYQGGSIGGGWRL
jgi:hypothetical protein